MRFHSEFDDLADRIAAFMAQPEAGQFNDLARDVFAHQLARNPPYAAYCRQRGVSAATVNAWEEIPFIGTSAFKQCVLSSLPEAGRTTCFFSSGTSVGDRSRHFHNASSLQLYERSVSAWFHGGFLGGQPGGAPSCGLEVVSLTPSPEAAPNSSLARMFHTLRPGKARFFGWVNDSGGWEVDAAGLREFLEKTRRPDFPVLIAGTAFNFVHVLDQCSTSPMPLPPESLILETGGYKGRSRELAKPELHACLAQFFQAPPGRVRCEYGMSELGSQGYDHPNTPGLFAFPPWTRVRVVSPEDGRVEPEGIPGLIQIFDLANAGSVSAVQTEDLGVLRGARLELLGRVQSAQPKGCSLLAA